MEPYVFTKMVFIFKCLIEGVVNFFYIDMLYILDLYGEVKEYV